MLFLKYLLKNFYIFLTNPRYRKFIYFMFRYGGVKRYKSGSINMNGHHFFIVDYLSFIWQYKEIFVDEYYHFPSINLNPVIFDCGANIGTSCAYYKMLYPNCKIIAFEADPNITDILINNMKHITDNSIEVVNAAVWNNNGEIELQLEGADGASVMNLQNYQNVTKVKSVRLKEWINKYSKIDFLKMDIEGAEVEVIEDCKDVLHNINYLFVEYHSYIGQPQRLSEILSVISKCGFRYFIAPVHQVSRPFYYKSKGNQIDLQVNIFATNLNLK